MGRVAAAPTELLTPEGVAHPNWTPVLGTLSAEQGGDKACFDDFKKRKNTRLPPWAASQDVKGTTRCPLLPSAQSWLVRRSLAPPGWPRGPCSRHRAGVRSVLGSMVSP